MPTENQKILADAPHIVAAGIKSKHVKLPRKPAVSAIERKPRPRQQVRPHVMSAIDGADPDIVKRIKEAVSNEWGVSLRAIDGISRSQLIVGARHAAMRLAMLYTRLSLSDAAKQFKRRDHGTVSYACSNALFMIETDEAYRMKFERARAAVTAMQITESGCLTIGCDEGVEDEIMHLPEDIHANAMKLYRKIYQAGWRAGREWQRQINNQQ